ncbi:MAG: ATP-binding cassette domain-containing protein [Azospirillum sp.]|nr:ATP-binding cassette domain-containing protein [Azospirillum sp.]
MLQITDLTFRYGGRLLLDHANASVGKGQRVALVGRNGTGKTTLLRLIVGELAPDGGSLGLPAGWRIGVLPQDAPDGEDSLLDTVLGFDRERAALLAESEHAHDPERIAAIHTRLADIHAHSAPARAAAILAGLGFDSVAQARPCAAFSGGWRMRVALAGVLFSAPDLLLLDEPTNHLDLEAVLWLEGYLRGYPGTLVLVSHDRDLLNTVPTATLHIDQQKLVAYPGGYDQFERTRAANRARLAAEQTRQEAQRRHIQSFIDRFRAKATKARQAQSRVKALERMAPIIGMVDEDAPVFNLPAPDALAPPLITLDDAAVGYDGKPVLRGLDLRIDMDDRIALLGANGNGKSTLVKLLAGRLAPLSGRMHRSPKLRIGYFAQHQAEELDLTATPIQQLARAMPQAPLEKVRAHLGRFGFGQTRAEVPIGQLSGGEKARLLLALMARTAPHMLLLDEPTNHLDIDSRAALVQALNDYDGAVIVISHDPTLIELVAERLWLVGDGTCKPFEGDFDDYRRLLDQRRSQGNGAEVGRRDAAGRRRDQRRAAAESRAALAPLKRRASQAETLVERLGAERRRLEARLADPASYSGPAAALIQLQVELGEVNRRLAEAEEVWLEAAAAFESAAAEADSLPSAP